jgi:hypothetical protein
LEGTFVDVDDPSRPLERCPNVLALTHGQRAGIGGAADRWDKTASMQIHTRTLTHRLFVFTVPAYWHHRGSNDTPSIGVHAIICRH